MILPNSEKYKFASPILKHNFFSKSNKNQYS